MKKLLTLLCCVVFCAVLSAQDIIVTAKAERIEALITEVSPTEIRYKKWSFQDGPTFVIGVSDLSAIIFKNGEVQVFNKKRNGTNHTNNNPTDANRAFDGNNHHHAANAVQSIGRKQEKRF